MTSDEKPFESPPWHQHELQKTEVDFAAGRVEALDWEHAKKELRERLHEAAGPV